MRALAATAALGLGALAVWTIAQAEARQPGTARAGAESFSDAGSATVSGGVAIIVNGANEAAAVLPNAAAATATTVDPNAEPDNYGGEQTSGQ